MWVSEEGSGRGVGGGEWEEGGGVVGKVGAGAKRGQPHV